MTTMFDTYEDAEDATVAGTVLTLRTARYYADSDRGGALYRRVDSEPTDHQGTLQSDDGAWWELMPENGVVSPSQFGAIGDGVLDDRQPVQDAWQYAALKKVKCIMDVPVAIDGNLVTYSDLHVEWLSGCWTKQIGFSLGGSFICNVPAATSSAASVPQSNITFINPLVDGSSYPEPIILPVVSATNGVSPAKATIELGDGASSVDDFYVGTQIHIVDGTGVGGFAGAITDYDGGTQTATMGLSIWSGALPDNTSVAQIGWNDNAIAFTGGVSKVRITGGILKNYPQKKMTLNFAGGKGINFESGDWDCIVTGTTVEHCFHGLFVQGHKTIVSPGFNDNPRRASGIKFIGCHLKNCGSAIAVFGHTANADPDGDPFDSLVQFSDITFENCGHAPWKTMSGQTKSGIINFGEAQNVQINGVKGFNSSSAFVDAAASPRFDYPEDDPGYPGSLILPEPYPSRTGYNLTGPVGALIWGWGRNISIRDVEYHGDCDQLVRIQRVQALGNDAGPIGKAENVFRFDLHGVKHYGEAGHVLTLEPSSGIRVAANELTGTWTGIHTDTLLSGICGAELSGYGGVTMEVIEQSTNKRIRGSASAIQASFNTFSAASALSTETGDVQLPSGSNASAPGLRLGNATSGLWRDGSGIRVTVDGTDGALFSATGMTVQRNGAGVQFNAIGDTGAAMAIRRAGDNASAPSFSFQKSRGTTAGATAVAQSDSIGSVLWQAHSGSGFVFPGGLDLHVIETAPGPAAMGARLSMSLAPTGSVTRSEVVRLEHDTGLSMYGANPVIDENRHVRLRSYLLASLPSAGAAAGQAIFCSNLGGGGGELVSDGSNWRRGSRGGQQTVATNADFTLTTLTSAEDQKHTGTLTADRTITLSTTNAYSGARFRVARTGAGAFNLSLGGLKNLVQNSWAEAVYDGSAWTLAAYGTL